MSGHPRRPRVFHITRLPPGVPPQEVVYVGPPLELPPGVRAAPHFRTPFTSRARSARLRLREYRAFLEGAPRLRAEIRRQLKNKHLACVCAPVPCHADVLLEIARQPQSPAESGVDC